MSRDEFGMPLPDRRLLPLSLNEDGEVVDRDGDEVELWCDRNFFIHAANNIIPAREIVRRLIEWHCGPIDKHVSLCDIVSDAEKLWAKMQSEVSDGA